jgi:hypothetical protein
MIQRRDGPNLAVEAFAEAPGRDLDGNVPSRARIVRAVHPSHPAFADLRKDFVRPEFVACRKRHGDGNKFIVTTDGFTS